MAAMAATQAVALSRLTSPVPAPIPSRSFFGTADKLKFSSRLCSNVRGLFAFASSHNVAVVCIGLTGFCFFQGKKSNKKIVAALPDVGPEYFAEKPPTPLLDTINYPIHMKNLTVRVRNETPLNCL